MKIKPYILGLLTIPTLILIAILVFGIGKWRKVLWFLHIMGWVRQQDGLKVNDENSFN